MRMAAAVPVDVGEEAPTRLEVVAKGMARTAKLQHGTTNVWWVGVVVALMQFASGADNAGELQAALNERAQAFYHHVADWTRLRQHV